MEGTWNERRYLDARRRYRRRMLPVIVVVGALVIGVYSAAAVYFDTRLWWWGAGLIAGTVVGVGGMLSDIAPEHIRRRQRGIAGERRTRKALRKLESSGWRVRHGIDVGKGDIDHLLTGPNGDYILETKALLGAIAVEKGVLVTRQTDDPEEVWRWHGLSRRLNELGAEVSSWIRRDTGVRRWVQPVVVIWGDFPQGLVEHRVVYVAGDRLVDWLRNRPPRRDEIDFDDPA